MLACFGTSAMAKGVAGGSYADQSHDDSKVAIESSLTIVDEDGNLIGNYNEQNVSTRAFPCCREYGKGELIDVKLYRHDLIDPLCKAYTQNAKMCHACNYVAIQDSSWVSLGSHNIYTQPGKWNCGN